jgi:hypothetical protein
VNCFEKQQVTTGRFSREFSKNPEIPWPIRRSALKFKIE